MSLSSFFAENNNKNKLINLMLVAVFTADLNRKLFIKNALF